MQGPRSDAKIVVNPLEIQNASVHLCPRACPRATSRHYAWVGRQYALKSGGNLSEFRREDCLLDFFREKPHYGLSYFRPPRTWVDRAGHYSCFHTHYELSYYRQPTTVLIKIAGGQETLILTVRINICQFKSCRKVLNSILNNGLAQYSKMLLSILCRPTNYIIIRVKIGLPPPLHTHAFLKFHNDLPS